MDAVCKQADEGSSSHLHRFTSSSSICFLFPTFHHQFLSIWVRAHVGYLFV